MAKCPSIGNSFFANIKNSELLSKEKEREIFRKFRETGDLKYRDKIILANTRFVIRAAIDFKTPGVDIHDLFSEGLYGLIHAISYFELSQDVKFFSYAAYWIKHYIRKFINDSSSVKVPTGTVKRLRQMIVNNEIAEVDGNEKDQMALSAMKMPVSMDSCIGDTTLTPGEILADTRTESAAKVHYGKVLCDELIRLVNCNLPSVKADIILKTYGLGNNEIEQTLRDISSSSRYSHERIRQLRIEAINELRNSPELQNYNNKFNEYTQMS